MLLKNKFGKASSSVVIEEFLDGIELSCFVLTNGKDHKVFPMAKDYKKIGELDTGLNTGGMGAVSPVPFVDEEFKMKIKESLKSLESTKLLGLLVSNLKALAVACVGLVLVFILIMPSVILDVCKLISWNPSTTISKK